MKHLIALFLFAISVVSTHAQLNMEFRSSIAYTQEANDIWGYVDGNQREYALVGLNMGVSIIDVTFPDNPVELGIAEGPGSTWRDIKTWGTYAYVTVDRLDANNDVGPGVLVIDLSGLPSPITSDDYYYIKPTLPNGQEITVCHNIYIDEFGFAYITGCNETPQAQVNAGGPIIYDLKPTPGQMEYVGQTPPVYAHDVYTINNKLYTSDIYNGAFSIYDVSDKANLQLLGSQNTPFAFTHNVWISDDETIAYTTDEKANAPVGAYDVSDPNNIEELFQFRPIETVGEGVIPHNVHVWDDYLIISYYSDGCIIVDASEPDHLIEVGNFDTYIPANQGFNGAWGAYPYLPSGTVLVSDIGSGLYVLTPTYKRAARLKGTVLDSITGFPVVGAEILITSTQANYAESNFQGDYKTGVAEAGDYEVTFTKAGYFDKTINVNLANGQILDIETILVPKGIFSGSVIHAADGSSIKDAQLLFTAGTEIIEGKTNNDGDFRVAIEPGTYNLIVGAWGFQYQEIPVIVTDGGELVIEMEPGYEDNFALDLGWKIETDASTGEWERAEPIGTIRNGVQANPELDLQDDISDKCYTTGNGGGNAPDDDIDGGSTFLTSAEIDLSEIENPTLNFSYWWYEGGGNTEPNDGLEAYLIQDGQKTLVATFEDLIQWTEASFTISDFVDATGIIQVEFHAYDQSPGHLAEAAIDGFSIQGTYLNSGVNELSTDDFIELAPNPFSDQILVTYENEGTLTSMNIINLNGQLIENIELEKGTNSIQIGAQLEAGIYFVQVVSNEKSYSPSKIVKLGN